MVPLRVESTFEPRDPNYRARVHASFARQRAMRSFQIALARLDPGVVELTFPYQIELTQQHGFLHAGVVCTALDSGCGYAAFSLMPADAAVLTVEFKVNLLAPAAGDAFRVVAQVVKAGRTLTICRADAYAQQEGRQRHVATMTGTLMALFGRDGIEQ
jgi:uncharacterized protein (TIGR00369 family)